MPSRNTMQQKIIAEQLNAMGNHPTADDVYRAVSIDHPSISKATVYRTLNKMSERGTALRVSVSNGADHFDHQTHPHCHVLCTVCGRVDDVDIDPSLDNIDNLACDKSNGYVISGHKLRFMGVCPNCQQNMEASSDAQ